MLLPAPAVDAARRYCGMDALRGFHASKLDVSYVQGLQQPPC